MKIQIVGQFEKWKRKLEPNKKTREDKKRDIWFLGVMKKHFVKLEKIGDWVK